MLTFAWPWLLLVAAAPLVLGRFAPPFRERREALEVPFLRRLAELSGRRPGEGAGVARIALLQRAQILACMALFAAALARPQWIGAPVVEEQPARDLLLSVDLSGSMDTRDFRSASGETVDRLTAVKEVLDPFLGRREGDRVALVVFGTAPYLQVPFTRDLALCRALLDEAQVRMAGPKTALGDSIGLAVRLFEASELERKVMIALTDGNDTASFVPPENAARVAADAGIVIHAVAVGDPRAAGEQALDEVVLRAIADTTGGRYYHAEDRDALERIYAELDALETRLVEARAYRPRTELYWIPVALALALNMGFHAVSALSYVLARRGARAQGSPS